MIADVLSRAQEASRALVLAEFCCHPGQGFEHHGQAVSVVNGVLARRRLTCLRFAASLILLALPLSGCGTGALWDKFLAKDGFYELICGEGRLIAQKRLGKSHICAEVVTCTRKQAYLESLIERVTAALFTVPGAHAVVWATHTSSEAIDPTGAPAIRTCSPGTANASSRPDSTRREFS